MLSHVVIGCKVPFLKCIQSDTLSEAIQLLWTGSSHRILNCKTIHCLDIIEELDLHCTIALRTSQNVSFWLRTQVMSIPAAVKPSLFAASYIGISHVAVKGYIDVINSVSKY